MRVHSRARPIGRSTNREYAKAGRSPHRLGRPALAASTGPVTAGQPGDPTEPGGTAAKPVGV